MRVLTLLIFVLSANYFFAQVADKKWPLIIVLDTENEKYINKLQKKDTPEKLQLYKKLINDYNTYIKEAISTNFNFFYSVQYITDVEYNKLSKDEKDEKYFLIHSFPMVLSNSPVTTGTGPTRRTSSSSWTSENKESITLDINNKSDYSIITLETETKNPKSVLQTIVKNTPRLFCSKADVFFAIRQINRECDEEKRKPIKKKKPEFIGSKTLIINASDLVSGFQEDKIKSMCPYPFKIVDKEAFDNYILSEENDHICLYIIPMATSPTQVMYVHTMYDPSTNELIYVGLNAWSAMGGDNYEKISGKSFKVDMK